jgi:hypothetical protein
MDVSGDGNALSFAGDFALVNGASPQGGRGVERHSDPAGLEPGSTADVVGDLTLSSSGRTVFVGGHCTTVDGPALDHLGALRASGGGLESWNPGANGVFGAFGAAITSSRVAFGGEFT